MEWIIENWFLLLLLGGCMGMHLFMHRRGHGNQNHHYFGGADTGEQSPPNFGVSAAPTEYEDAGITVRPVDGESDNYHVGCCCETDQKSEECVRK